VALSLQVHGQELAIRPIQQKHGRKLKQIRVSLLRFGAMKREKGVVDE
jgi:hypothetical protein